jgi:hypothetical protein
MNQAETVQSFKSGGGMGLHLIHIVSRRGMQNGLILTLIRLLSESMEISSDVCSDTEARVRELFQGF